MKAQWSPISHKIGLALFVVPAKGRTAQRLTAEDIAGGDHAAWSPDGKWIAFRTHADQEPGEGPTELSLIHPDGSGLRQPKTPEDDVLSASFSPDGECTRRRPHLRCLGDARGRLGPEPDHADDCLGLGAGLGSVTRSHPDEQRTEGGTNEG